MEFSERIIHLNNCLNSLSRELAFVLKYRVIDLPKYDNKKPILFGHFPWYYRLVTRGSGLYVSKPGSYFFSIAPNWQSDGNAFLKEKYIIVRPELNVKQVHPFIDFVRSFNKKSKSQILVKQVAPPVYKILLENGFREYSKNEAWDNESKYDDQTYSEIVLELKNIIPNNNLARGKIKDKVDNNDYYIEQIELQDFNNIYNRELVKENIFQVFYEWLRSFQQRNPLAINKSFLSWNLLTIDAMISDRKLEIIFIKDVCNETPIGVFCLSKASQKQYDMVFSFVSEFRGNFQRVAYDLLIQWIIRKYDIEYLNLGGSELQSLYDFKKTLGLHTELHTYHLLFG